MVGNGAVPIQLLAVNRDAIYTRPDRTANELAMVNLRGSGQLGPAMSIDGVAYFRSSNTGTYNGDDSDFVANTELDALDGERQAVGCGVFAGEAFTALDKATRNFSIYAV